MAQVAICIFTAAYAIEMALHDKPPDCACLGLWQRYFDNMDSGLHIVSRNLILLAILSASAMAWMAETGNPKPLSLQRKP
jgi:hypothetical protein